MALVASVDYVAKRIYLSAASAAAVDLDTMDVYREVRALRASTLAHRAFKPMIIGGGNIEKIAGYSYTASYVQLLYGCRIVPYNASHYLRVIRDTFTDDGVAGRDCFDRTSLSPSVVVDIDVQVDAVEIRVVQTGGSAGLTVADIVDGMRTDLTPELTMVSKVAKLHAVGATLTVTPTTRTAGDVVQTISTVGEVTTIS